MLELALLHSCPSGWVALYRRLYCIFYGTVDNILLVLFNTEQARCNVRAETRAAGSSHPSLSEQAWSRVGSVNIHAQPNHRSGGKCLAERMHKHVYRCVYTGVDIRNEGTHWNTHYSLQKPSDSLVHGSMSDICVC